MRLQIELHPRCPQHQLRKLCKDNHIAVIAYSSLGIGDLLHHPKVLQVAKETHHTAAQVEFALKLCHAASASKAVLGLSLPSCEQTSAELERYAL